MARRNTDFREEDKIKVLLWSARHCCLCGKGVGMGIEVARLDPRKTDIDNAIPLCVECHAAVGHQNARHPRGRKFGIQELKARREQVYELHTRVLVSPVQYRVTQGLREFPDVGFELRNLGDIYPVRVRVTITLSQGDRVYGCPKPAGHYDGKYLWNLNPRCGASGQFEVPRTALDPSLGRLNARVDLTVIDLYEREHSLLPGGFVHTLEPGTDWSFEPAEEVFGPRGADR